MTREDLQPYKSAPSGHGYYAVHRMDTERPGTIIRTVLTVRTATFAGLVADKMNEAYAEGRKSARG